jgi:predicted glycosyltransferase
MQEWLAALPWLEVKEVGVGVLLVGGRSRRGELRVLKHQIGVVALRVLTEGRTGKVRVEKVLLLLLLLLLMLRGLLVVAGGGGCGVKLVETDLMLIQPVQDLLMRQV